jgi:gluconate 2-dehydrogenase alpha chain
MQKVVGNASLSKFDVLVIGSGAGGGAVTHLLCKLGQKVLVLEAGANRFEGLDDPSKQPVARFSNDELKLNGRSFIAPFTHAEPRVWVGAGATSRPKLTAVNTLAKTVGGAAVHADLKAPRFRPTDFQLGTLLAGQYPGASFADWPVDYDMLEPFYYYAEQVMGVQGVAGLDPLEGPRPSGDFPMTPGVPMYVGVKVSDGAKSLGYHPFPYPTAVNSRPYDGRPACVDCGFCSGYGCPSNAKGAPPVTTLRRALLSGNCQLLPETRAVKLQFSGDRSAVVGVEALDPDGKRRVFTADRYVLALSPIEDVRLLQLSDPAAGNSSGLIGRNLTFHFQTNAAGIFDARVHGHRGRTVTHGFADFRGVPGDANRPLGGIVEISGSEFPIEEASRYLDIFSLVGGFTGALFKKLLRQSPGRDRVVALAMQAEDAPQPTNRVELDPRVRDLDGLPVARVTYQNHAFELGARDFYGPKLIGLLGASGARWALVAPMDDIPQSQHVMGTLRFGADPATSVCDPNGRFHDIGNLYNADGALFPTSSGFNPTLTLVALAMRVGAAMVLGDHPERGLS